MKTSSVLLNNDHLYSKRWLVITTIMMVAILEVLDSTIVNVALPHIMSSLGTNQNQITWVLTSYVVSSAIMLPLTGFFSSRIGQKQLLLTNITGFMVSS
ncbi:MFS transporter, partial [Coxiella endosymbiont of Rhipicephalus microplus]